VDIPVIGIIINLNLQKLLGVKKIIIGNIINPEQQFSRCPSFCSKLLFDFFSDLSIDLPIGKDPIRVPS